MKAAMLSKLVWSWRLFREFPLQQRAQQIGHRHALREGRYLDARPHGGRDVEGQAGRVEVAFLEVIGTALANPRLGVRIRGRASADADALARALAGRSAHDGHRSRSEEPRLNSSHSQISYAVFCLKKKKTSMQPQTLAQHTLP